ncbi:hypothetical protein M0804_014535 [Polistes exclamans]|nr:hypothetical protein M0804_014539 [Polistes exclamans]KAI4475047.1 hypothetical protein M0804_014535 [Polistes exclamans]
MHLHFEKNNNAKCDCNILSLSWMGKVPDESPENFKKQFLEIVYSNEPPKGKDIYDRLWMEDVIKSKA